MIEHDRLIAAAQEISVQLSGGLGESETGGAAINTIFMGHFQDMARGHFIVRRLERMYGEEVVKSTYDTLGGAIT